MYYEDENQYMPDEDYDPNMDDIMREADMHFFYLDQQRLIAAGPEYYNVPKITYPTDDLPF